MRIDSVDQLIGKCEVGDSIGILASIIIVVITAKGLSQTMTVVEH